MAVDDIIGSREHDLGDFSVRRVLPHGRRKMVGPWIFFDHMGPAVFPAGKGVNVRPHPHINLATVTYLFDGEILHRDSLGNTLSIQPGDINLMVAGRGITHSERERDEVRNIEHSLHGLQLWHALPEEFEEIDPAFYHYRADELPRFSEAGVHIRLMIGSAYGSTSPVKTFTDTLYAEAHLNAGQALKLPGAEELGVYVASGKIQFGQEDVNQYQMALLDGKKPASITALEDSCVAIIGGNAMPERRSTARSGLSACWIPLAA